MAIEQLIAECELFAELSDEELEELSEASSSIVARRNHVLFEQADDADDLYIIRTGRIAISKKTRDGRESVVTLMEDNELFGELSLFDHEGRSAAARALETTELIMVPYTAVRTIFERHPELLWHVLQLIAQRLRTTDTALADSVFLDVTGRTAKRLLELSGGHDEFTIPITQEELANMVGASRERINKAIAMFVRLGWLETYDRHYKIIDREQLEQRSH